MKRLAVPIGTRRQLGRLRLGKPLRVYLLGQLEHLFGAFLAVRLPSGGRLVERHLGREAWKGESSARARPREPGWYPG